MPNDSQTPDPALVLDLLEAFRRSKTLFVGVSLGLFDALENGPQTASELARDLQANADAVSRLADACVGLKLLRKEGDRYRNTPVASTYLTSSSPRRITGYINYSNKVLWNLWTHLEDAVRDGTHRWQQAFGLDGPIFANFFRSPDARREFLMGMHGYGVIGSPHVVTAFDLGRFQRLVDLGGGTGHLAIEACKRYPNLRAVVFDLPEVRSLAQEAVAASPVADRVEIVAGDFFADPLPEADLYALGRILHDWSEPKVVTLLERVCDRLPPHGGVLIAEKLLLDDKSGPSWAQMQDLNMLICTEGRERTLAGYERLLKQAGFREVRGCQIPAPLDAILALKQSSNLERDEQ